MVLEGSLLDRDCLWSHSPDRWIIEQPFRILEPNSDSFFRNIPFIFWVTVWNWKLTHRWLFYNTTWIVHEEICYWPTKSLHWAGITLFACQVELHYVKSDSSKLNKQVIYSCCITSLNSQLWLHGMYSVTSGLKDKYLTLIAEFCISRYHPKMNGYVTSAPLGGWPRLRVVKEKFHSGQNFQQYTWLFICLRESQKYGSTLLRKK